MINDKLGQISLIRPPRNKKERKKRKTQSLKSTANLNSNSLDPVQRYTLNIYTLSADEVFINYSEDMPKNDIKRNSGFSFGNVEKDTFSSFDEGLVDYKEKTSNMNTQKSFLINRFTETENRNSKYDVFKRRPETINLSNNPFSSENNDTIKASIDAALPGKKIASNLITNSYENRDIKDPFIDNTSLNLESGVYIVRNNYYNKGSNTAFVDQDNIRNNTIIKNKDSGGQYYGSKLYYTSAGFFNKSKKPDSIAFGGLKR
tara:strand:- start:473 stop:1252 length:780 start_codon:yes stop_codon:yes gene_type:complete